MTTLTTTQYLIATDGPPQSSGRYLYYGRARGEPLIADFRLKTATSSPFGAYGPTTRVSMGEWYSTYGDQYGPYALVDPQAWAPLPRSSDLARVTMSDDVKRMQAKSLLAEVGGAAKAFIRVGEEFDYDPGVIHEYVDRLEAKLSAYYQACESDGDHAMEI